MGRVDEKPGAQLVLLGLSVVPDVHGAAGAESRRKIFPGRFHGDLCRADDNHAADGRVRGRGRDVCQPNASRDVASERCERNATDRPME